MTSAEARPAEPTIAELLAEVRALAIAAAPPAWPELGAAIRAMLPEPLPPHSAIPLAMTQAAGGRLIDGVPFAVIWTLISAAVRILDDCADDDVPHALHRSVGLGRSLNYASALLQLSSALLHALPRTAGRDELLEGYTAASLQLAAGQDRDLVGEVSDVAAYVRIVEDKTCAGYEFACFGGARVAGAPGSVQQACRRAGYHLGMVLQLLDDLESAWLPDGDLAHGRRTFPVWHGLARAKGTTAEELRSLVFGGEAKAKAPELRRLLEELEAPRSVLAAALEERGLAMRALERCPGPADLLASYFDFLFADAATLLRGEARESR